MDQIEQLKVMHDEALQRLQLNLDYKLAISLDALIEDLEAFIAPVAGDLSEPQEGEDDEESDDEPTEVTSSEDGGEADVKERADDGSLNDTIPIDSEASAAIEALETELAQATGEEES